ncbi:hypothetical protein Hamer_G018214 [Homarus americanus]|uniref:Uncharacterized protein n=1 Tax=Homarus americanus TaxID=6706 RepID=A0A8J5JHN3_HOMAM|nr:hypothetical protein Hamer_G018214 [Homarus americanus]
MSEGSGPEGHVQVEEVAKECRWIRALPVGGVAVHKTWLVLERDINAGLNFGASFGFEEVWKDEVAEEFRGLLVGGVAVHKTWLVLERDINAGLSFGGGFGFEEVSKDEVAEEFGGLLVGGVAVHKTWLVLEREINAGLSFGGSFGSLFEGGGCSSDSRRKRSVVIAPSVRTNNGGAEEEDFGKGVRDVTKQPMRIKGMRSIGRRDERHGSRTGRSTLTQRAREGVGDDGERLCEESWQVRGYRRSGRRTDPRGEASRRSASLQFEEVSKDEVAEEFGGLLVGGVAVHKTWLVLEREINAGLSFGGSFGVSIVVPERRLGY